MDFVTNVGAKLNKKLKKYKKAAVVRLLLYLGLSCVQREKHNNNSKDTTFLFSILKKHIKPKQKVHLNYNIFQYMIQKE